MNLYIVTGASRGLGLGISRSILTRGGSLTAVARIESPALKQIGEGLPEYRLISQDLTDITTLQETAEALLDQISPDRWEGIYLINNAATIGPISTVGNYDNGAMADGMATNLLAPIILCNAFVAQLADATNDRRILNISSSAGRKPYAGWGSYCAAKAGLDMFTRCLSEEQSTYRNGFRVASIAPGVVDTDMQKSIRNYNAVLLPSRP